MPGLKNLKPQQVKKKIDEFPQKYAANWNHWLAVKKNAPNNLPTVFGDTLRKWQACRPNTMRRNKDGAFHAPPFLDDLIEQAESSLTTLNHFEMRSADLFNKDVKKALNKLWEIFKHLSYKGKAHKGLAGIVGISKAVLLLTEGRIGPAFDSTVRVNIKIKEINDPISWIVELKNVAQDIKEFERKNSCLLTDCAPTDYSKFHYGRLYDMVFGPRV
jgi:hypothetical protein